MQACNIENKFEEHERSSCMLGCGAKRWTSKDKLSNSHDWTWAASFRSASEAATANSQAAHGPFGAFIYSCPSVFDDLWIAQAMTFLSECEVPSVNGTIKLLWVKYSETIINHPFGNGLYHLKLWSNDMRLVFLRGITIFIQVISDLPLGFPLGTHWRHPRRVLACKTRLTSLHQNSKICGLLHSLQTLPPKQHLVSLMNRLWITPHLPFCWAKLYPCSCRSHPSCA